MKYLKITRLIFTVAILAGLICVSNGCAKPPTASFTSDKTRAAVGEAIQFSDQSTGEITSWSWDFGDGNTSNEENPSHAYKEGGRYFVSLVVSNKAGRNFDRLEVTIAGSQIGTPLTDTPLSDTPQTGTPLMDSPITVNMGGLTISQIKMCSGLIEKDECRPKPGATYYTGDHVSVWFEIIGFDVRRKDGKYEHWIQFKSYTAYDPDGRVLFTDSNLNESLKFSASADVAEPLHGWWNIGWVEASDPPGQYRAEIVITDRISGQTVTKTIAFTIK